MQHTQPLAISDKSDFLHTILKWANFLWVFCSQWLNLDVEDLLWLFLFYFLKIFPLLFLDNALLRLHDTRISDLLFLIKPTITVSFLTSLHRLGCQQKLLFQMVSVLYSVVPKVYIAIVVRSPVLFLLMIFFKYFLYS